MSDDEKLVERIRRDLYDGNGRQPLLKEVEVIRQRTDAMYKDMYHDPRTGESGLVSDVRYIKRAMVYVKGAAAAIMVGGVAGAAAAVRFLVGG